MFYVHYKLKVSCGQINSSHPKIHHQMTRHHHHQWDLHLHHHHQRNVHL